MIVLAGLNSWKCRQGGQGGTEQWQEREDVLRFRFEMIEMAEAHIGAMLVLAAVETQLASLACNDEPTADAKVELTAGTSGFAWITIVEDPRADHIRHNHSKAVQQARYALLAAGRHY